MRFLVGSESGMRLAHAGDLKVAPTDLEPLLYYWHRGLGHEP
jgi:hypothetical protein